MIDAPLGLSNLLTFFLACACLGTMSAQVRAEVVPVWRLAVPAVFAAVVALVLLAGVFQATPMHDGEWMVALIAGGIAGRLRGKALPVEVDRVWGLVRLPRVLDGRLAAGLIVVMSIIDFCSAAMGAPVVDPVHVASITAACAGYIGYRAIIVAMRSGYGTHVELHAAQRR